MADNGDAVCPLCSAPDAPRCYEGCDLLHGGAETFRYRECAVCGAVFQSPLPDAERIRSYYPDDYIAYRAEQPKAPGALERAVLRARFGYGHLVAPLWARALAPLAGVLAYRRQVRFVEGGRLLDVGCGNGKFLAAMRALGWTVAGIDADPRAVAACREQGLDVREGTIDAGGAGAGGFHCVTARHVIEHVPDPDAFVGGVAAALRPGGHLHLRTPNAAALGRRGFGPHWYANDIPRHLVLFSPENLDRLLSRHGLERVSLGTRSTPKVLLNSRDYRRGHRGRPSRYGRWARLRARPQVWLSRLLGRGYEIVADYRKPS